jgi:hypothetical protein
MSQSKRQTAEAKSCLRCAIYTRKSTEEGLEQMFDSLNGRDRRFPAR